MQSEYTNPRYVAYAASQGRSPSEQMAHDDIEYPGGIMTGFILWIPNAWREWAKDKKLSPEKVKQLRSNRASQEQHDDFDGWLREKYKGLR